MGDSCLPENRVIKPFTAGTSVLAQAGLLGQVIGGDCSDLQCSERSAVQW
ncbi:hypothetical protein EV13_0759 [Prochlorococcus sp. MIT 0702]|nr:hypothetical protein EV12_0283 [Prochlorococcus sp. MIT 0701]KGG29955.1 hypothetical protein EV13_0759 [Prochlorococcus sp. MIT 0702]KGG36957.1 hypothetical protein EV14_0167 [Prochlorococcus sp. MIT 0703]